jgi:DNA modification methylase
MNRMKMMMTQTNQKMNQNQQQIKLNPEQINLGQWRARQAVGDLDTLKESIKNHGQLHAITVAAEDADEYRLISGHRRLLACLDLEISINAIVIQPDSELSELDIQIEENMSRKDFDRLETGRWLARRKEIYEQQHPETIYKPKNWRHAKKDLSDNPAPSFVESTSKKFGVGKDMIYELLTLASLPDKNLERIESAKTVRSRNKQAMAEIGKIRKAKRLKKLEERAEEVARTRPITEKEREDKCKIIYGDCYKKLAEFPDDSFELALTDPPYGRPKSLISFENRTDISSDFGPWDVSKVSWIKELPRLIIDGGQLLIFCPMEMIGVYNQAIDEAGFTYRCTIIWHKTNPPLTLRPGYCSACEAIVWAVKGTEPPFIHFGMERAEHNIIEGPICQGDERVGAHPTQKPLWLVNRLLLRHASKKARVLDPFMGTGTTVIGARANDLYSVGIEKDKKFFDIAKLRLKIS